MSQLPDVTVSLMPPISVEVALVKPGPRGLSAYALAGGDEAFGSLSNWLESLVGGTGKSAYELALQNGFEGTLGEWLTSLVSTVAGPKPVKDVDYFDGHTPEKDVDYFDGEDGKSVSIAYSVDGATNYHSTYAAGDKYLKVQIGTDGWSEAMKFIGNNGSDATQIEIGVYNSNICWRYVGSGDEGWTVICTLASIAGQNATTTSLGNGTTAGLSLFNLSATLKAEYDALTANVSYGELYFNNGEQYHTTTIAAGATALLTGFTAAGPCRNVTSNAANGTHTVDKAGVYEVILIGSFNCSSSLTGRWWVEVNGVAKDNLKTRKVMPNLASANPADPNLYGRVSLNAGDVVTIRMSHAGAGSSDMRAYYINFNIGRIGE